MAEINIEKKKTLWPWILLAIIVIGGIIVYFLLSDDDDVEDDNPVTMQETQPVENSEDEPALTSNTESTIADYSTYIDGDKDMGIDHEFTHSGLTKLIEAVRDVANDLNVNVDADLTEAKNNAEYILKDPMDVDHANKIRSAVQRISTAIGTIQQEHFPQMGQEIEELKNESQNIMPDTQTLNQKDDVKAFLQKAKSILNKMK